MEEPGRVQSMGSLRVGHDWTTSLSLFTFMHWRRKWQPTPVFLPGESQRRGSLVGCHLWDHTESDTTEVTYLPALAATHLPLCLQYGVGPVHSLLALLWYLLSPLFSEQAQHCLGLELFAGKFSLSLSLSFSLSGYPTVWVSISL